MTLTHKQVDRIIDLRRLEHYSIGKIAREMRIARNTVKKYLRLFHLLDPCYSSGGQRTSRYQDSINQSQAHKIRQLTTQLNEAQTRAGNLLQAFDTANTANDALNERVAQQETDLHNAKDKEQRLDAKLTATEKERDDFKHKYEEASRTNNQQKTAVEDSTGNLTTIRAESDRYKHLYEESQTQNKTNTQLIEDMKKSSDAKEDKYTKEKEAQIQKYKVLHTAFEEYKRQYPSEEKPKQPVITSEEIPTPSRPSQDTEEENDEIDEKSDTTDWVMIGAIGVTLLAAGVQIYNAATWRSPATPSPSLQTPR